MRKLTHDFNTPDILGNVFYNLNQRFRSYAIPYTFVSQLLLAFFSYLDLG